MAPKGVFSFVRYRDTLSVTGPSYNGSTRDSKSFSQGSIPWSARNIPTQRRNAMSKKNQKSVVFALIMPKTEIPFAELSITLKKFGKLRQDFESLGLRVELIDCKK